MRKSRKTFASVSALIAGLALAPALYAQDLLGSRGSLMGSGMMGHGGMMNMMGQMGQMAPMGKMSQMGSMDQMNQMMEQCGQMMQDAAGGGSGRPNEQWRKDSPATPEQKG
jgi:hypothetical protein